MRKAAEPPANKYLQIFFVLIDIMEFEHVGMLDQLQNGNFPFHLEGSG